jgi:hypothetical protein
MFNVRQYVLNTVSYMDTYSKRRSVGMLQEYSTEMYKNFSLYENETRYLVDTFTLLWILIYLSADSSLTAT